MLALITDPVEREARKKELTELSENGLRQADYSRKSNELAEQRKTQEAAHQKNIAWHQRATKQYDDLKTEHQESLEKIAALESAQNTPGSTLEDEAELQKQLKLARSEASEAHKKMGELAETVKGFNQMVSEGKLITAEKFNEEVNKRGDALGAAILDIIDLQEQHRKEFGSDLDRKALLEEVNQNNVSLKVAYKTVTEKPREEKMRKDITALVEKEWNEKHKHDNVPYAQGDPASQGPLQSRLQKKDTGIPDDVAADGSGRLASMMAAELRAEGKS